jgi:Protein of unknown function (DUF2628)
MTEETKLNDAPNDELVKIFVGEKFAYYQQKWQLTPGQFKGFNIAAFFLGVFWLIYRKMYLYVAIFLGLIFLDFVIEIFYPLPELISKLLNWVIATVFGVMGNYWYKLHTTKKVKSITESFSPEQLQSELAKQGGTDLTGVLIGLAILAGLVWHVFFSPV